MKLLHLSFVFIIIGGMLTWLTQEKGSVRIAPGEEVSSFMSEEGINSSLPSSIILEKFEIVYYPGGEVPRDYISHLIVDGQRETVSMNKILDLEGYRLCQSSYDNEGATVLSVNHDPYGIALSYMGYILFAIGGGWVLVNPRGRFRSLLRSLVILPFLLFCSFTAYSATQKNQDFKIAGVPRSTADSLRSKQVIYGGRIVTFNTLARDVVTKLYGKPDYRGLTPEQTVLSFRFFPKVWKDQPIIRIKDRTLKDSLGVTNDYVSLTELFDSAGNYKVSTLYSSIDDRHVRSLEELDEKVGIILTLLSGELISAADDEPLPGWRVRLELIYNSLPFGSIIFMLLLGAFIISASGLIVRRYEDILQIVAVVVLCCGLLVSIVNFAMQWILSERFPVANTYETLQFVVIMIELLALPVSKRGGLLFPLSMLMAGALALVAHMMEMNPVVTPLMPVLHSPWLSLHVSLVMTSYALLGFTFVIAVVALIGGDNDRRLQRLSLAMLYPGVWLLGLGIFSGAVWANVSWGEYWSWDPKETCALITFLIYAFPLHRRFLRKSKSFHIYMLFAILSIAMTYFGVNYLNSLHSYGN